MTSAVLAARLQITSSGLRKLEQAEAGDAITLSTLRRVEPANQLAVRFHHRLVTIHPFPNGNGRHVRLITDVLIEQLGAPRFSWGGDSSLVEASALRQQYIATQQQADRGPIDFLLAFARAR